MKLRETSIGFEKHIGRFNLPNIIANLLTLDIVDFYKDSVTRSRMDITVILVREGTLAIGWKFINITTYTLHRT